MTNEERIKALQMRLDGKSWEYIANVLGYSKTTVTEDLKACIVHPPRQVNCVYPALKRIIVERYGGSVYAFARDCGISNNAMYYVLPSKRPPGRKVLSAILSTTGLSYEEAFRRSE